MGHSGGNYRRPRDNFGKFRATGDRSGGSESLKCPISGKPAQADGEMYWGLSKSGTRQDTRATRLMNMAGWLTGSISGTTAGVSRMLRGVSRAGGGARREGE